MLLVVGCGVSTEDVEATVEARIARIPTPKPQIVIQEVDKIVKEVEVVKEVVKEIEVIREIPVEKIVEVEVLIEVTVVVTATATPMPTRTPTPTPTSTPIPTPTPVPIYIWDDRPENLPYELETDIGVAKAKYLNTQLTITGEVGYIAYEGDLDSYGREWTQSVIAFQTYVYKGGLKGAVWEQLYCYLDVAKETQQPISDEETDAGEQVVKVKVGDNVLVRGIVNDMEYGEMYLYPCSIVD